LPHLRWNAWCASSSATTARRLPCCARKRAGGREGGGQCGSGGARERGRRGRTLSAGRSAAYGAARLKCARRAGEGKKPSGSDAATRYVRMRLRARGARVSAERREPKLRDREERGDAPAIPPARRTAQRKRPPQVVPRLRQPPLVQRDPPAVVQERAAVALGDRLEAREGRVLRVVEDRVAQAQVGQGKVDAEGRVGEEEEGVALRGRVGRAARGAREME